MCDRSRRGKYSAEREYLKTDDLISWLVVVHGPGPPSQVLYSPLIPQPLTSHHVSGTSFITWMKVFLIQSSLFKIQDPHPTAFGPRQRNEANNTSWILPRVFTLTLVKTKIFRLHSRRVPCCPKNLHSGIGFGIYSSQLRGSFKYFSPSKDNSWAHMWYIILSLNDPWQQELNKGLLKLTLFR